MHDGMQYDPIQRQGQGQGQGHEPLKVGHSAIFKGVGGWQVTTDSLIRAQYLKLIGAGFLR